jgi:hypothetical protein
MNPFSTYYYIAKNNRIGGNQILQKAGYEDVPLSPEEMAMMFKDYVDNDGQVAIDALASIHPDSFLFQKQLQNADASSQQTKLNCDGCMRCQQTLSADATTPSITVDPNQAATVKNYNTLIIAGASVLALSIITVIIINSQK